MSIEFRLSIAQDNFRLDVDLELPGGGVTSLFGPSGCGKTSLLRAVAGLDRHPGGRLVVNGQTWQEGDRFVPTHERPIGYVFQEPSLFDHLDVQRNITFGFRRIASANRRVAVEQAIELLDLQSLLARRPAELSGGERQRVAIARALAVSPDLLLMDEPLAAVDVSRKQEILPYIESLHRELDIPVLHVSHLPEEVARFADHVVLIGTEGVIASGAVQDVFTRLDLPPAHESDAASLVDARVVADDEAFHLTRLGFSGGEFLVSRTGLAEGQEVRLCVAARDVSLTLERQQGTSILNILEARVEEITQEDEARMLVRLAVGPTPLIASITRKSAHDLQLEPGKTVFAQVKTVALLQ